MDLTTAMDYYSSEKARLDLINNKDAPEELLNKSKAGQKSSGQRKVSVVEHLFE